jgi:hypothetical protein
MNTDKPFLLTAGDDHYPLKGAGNWKGFYTCELDAMLQVKYIYDKSTLTGFQIDNEFYNWFEVIDIRKFDNGKSSEEICEVIDSYLEGK